MIKDPNVRAARARKLELVENRKNGPCEDCGVDLDPAIMRLVPNSAQMPVSDLVRSRGVKAVRAELAKYTRKCPNCASLSILL